MADEPNPKGGFTAKASAFVAANPPPSKDAPPATATPPVVVPPTTPPKDVAPIPPVTPPVTPPVAAPVVDPDEEIISGKRSPKSEDFRRVKGQKKEFEDKFNKADADLKKANEALEKALKSPKSTDAEIEGLRKKAAEADTLRERFETIAVEFSPEFHSKYQQRADAILNPLKASLPADKADKIIAAVQLPESEHKRKILAELTEEMDSFTQTEIAAANRELRGVTAEKQSKLTNATTELAAIQKQRSEEAEGRKSKLAALFEEAAKIRSGEMPVLQMKEGDEEWNTGVKQRLTNARAIFSGTLPPEQMADAAFWAASAPLFLQQASAQAKEITTLKETIAKLQGASPNLNGGGGGGNGNKPERGNFLGKFKTEM